MVGIEEDRFLWKTFSIKLPFFEAPVKQLLPPTHPIFLLPWGSSRNETSDFSAAPLSLTLILTGAERKPRLAGGEFHIATQLGFTERGGGIGPGRAVTGLVKRVV
jgi:hypothetical protein